MTSSHAAVIQIPAAAEDSSFESLFKAHYSRVARLAYRVIGDTGRAEEIASEVFWRLHRKPPASSVNVEGWLNRTAVRLALDNLRSGLRRTRYQSLSPPPHSSPDPEQSVQLFQERARVRSVLAALRPEYSEMLLLRADGCSYAEVAASLRMNPASIGTLLSRAEANFRKEYVNRYGNQ